MTRFKFRLRKYSGLGSKLTCPSCGKKRVFTPYVNYKTKEVINTTFGRCDREIKCGYHKFPKECNQGNSMDTETGTSLQSAPPILNEISFIGKMEMQRSKSHYEKNNLYQFLKDKFGGKKVLEQFNLYHVGTANHWKGSTVFWQVDHEHNVRTGKLMQYNAKTGRRVKKPYNRISWVHSVLKLTNFNLKQCLFGEHLIPKNLNKPVALVESEKTALIASICIPDFIWLATGGLSNLNKISCTVLRGRKIVLFPDLGAEEKWTKKADRIFGIRRYKVSTLLQNNATAMEQEQGLDLGDYLLDLERNEH